MNIEAGVRQLVAEIYGHDQAVVLSSHTLDTDLAGDSLDRVELAMAVEDHFDIRIEDEEAEVWKTVADVEGTVAKKRGLQ